MLYTNGNDVVRVQCAFVDTPEVEKITDFIGSQKAYATAYLLPNLLERKVALILIWIFPKEILCLEKLQK